MVNDVTIYSGRLFEAVQDVLNQANNDDETVVFYGLLGHSGNIRNASLPEDFELVTDTCDDILKSVDGSIKIPMFYDYEDVAKYVKDNIGLVKDKAGWHFIVNKFKKVNVPAAETDYDWLDGMNDDVAKYFDYKKFYEDIKEDDLLIDRLVDDLQEHYDYYADEI